MKKLTYSLLLTSILLFTYACEYDNYDEPAETFSGRIIDSTTGENFIMTSKGLDLRMEEISWSSTPSPRSINVKDDGTFINTKMFPGTYKIVPTNGAFWPVKDTAIVELKGGKTTHDFTVTPYLKITNFTHSLSGTTLTLSCKIEAVQVQGMPRLLDVKPFVAITQYVGDANISEYSEKAKIDINKMYSDEIKNTVYTMTVKDLKAGRTFYVRIGARVDDSYKKFNFSDIIEVKVP